MNPLTKMSITALAVVASGFAALLVLEPWLPEPESYFEFVERGRAGPFRIGMDRTSALAAATALGAEAIDVNLRFDQMNQTRTPDGVDKFANAEQIVVDFGAVRLDFDGDRVVSIYVGSSRQAQQHAPLFEGVTDREAALAALRRLLATYQFRPYGGALMTIDKPPIRIGEMSETEAAWLKKYDHWKFRARSVRKPIDTDSYSLEFDGDRLVRIRMFSPL